MKMSVPRLKLSELKGFPEKFGENGKIKTVIFIESANEIIDVLDKFGTIFMPVVKDMRGNARQLFELYQMDIENWEYIEDMILTAPNTNSRLWLLWLKRALELLERFFHYVINDPNIIAQKSDNLQPMIVKAYNEVLKPYHGFLLQKTFAVMNRWIPTRETLLGSEKHFEENVRQLQILMPRMKLHTEKVDKFLKENGFDDKTKV